EHLGRFRGAAGGQHLGGGEDGLAGLEVLVRRGAVVAGLGVGGGGEAVLAEHAVAARRVGGAAGARVGVGGALVLLGGLPARARLRPVAGGLVGFRRLARHAEAGELVGGFEGV